MKESIVTYSHEYFTVCLEIMEEKIHVDHTLNDETIAHICQ